MEKPKIKPAHTRELGTLRYAIWNNKSKNGKRRQNAEVSRSYMSSEDEWKEEKLNLRHHEVVLLRELLNHLLSDLNAHVANDSEK